MKVIRIVVAILFLGASAASLITCGGGSSDSSSDSPLNSISVSPAIPVGSAQKFSAIAFYSDGTSHDVSTLAVWTSSSASVATVNSTGLANGLAAGNTTITISFGGISIGTSLKVAPATLNSITVKSLYSSVPVNVSQQLTALGTYSDGTIHDLTAAVTWNSANPAVASVDSSGVATAGAAVGTATITATLGSISGNTVLNVVPGTLSSIALNPTNFTAPAGVTLQFTALGTYSDGKNYDITRMVTWTSSNTPAATVNGSGMVLCVAAGSTTVTASLGVISGSTTFTVNSATLSYLGIVPSIPAGAIQQFAAIGTKQDGSTQDISQMVFWTSSNTAVATVNSTGQATAVAPGLAAIIATTQSNYFPYLGGNISGGTNLVVTPFLIL